jgi:hypothetical protein
MKTVIREQGSRVGQASPYDLSGIRRPVKVVVVRNKGSQMPGPYDLAALRRMAPMRISVSKVNA